MPNVPRGFINPDMDPQNPFRPYPGSIAPDFSPPDYVFERQPAEGDKSAPLDWESVSSILAHAEHVPSGWANAPLAKLIRQRVELGIDANIHDATYWLREFECPDTIDGRITSNQNDEITLVLATFFGEDKAKLPTSETRIDNLFKSETVVRAYLAGLSEDVNHSQDLIDKIQSGELGRQSATTHSLLVSITTHCQQFGLTVSKEQQTETLRSLHEMAGVRKDYNHDAQSWLRTHGTTPRKKLIRAWKAREDALSDGVADNPTAIITWERKAGIARAYADMQREGVAPVDLSLQDLDDHQGFTWELSRVYENRTVVKALGNFLKNKSGESLFPATSIELSDGSHIEVLAKDDPRIFTVGEDTGCCMTPTGAAHECLEAAYQDPRVSILALYDAKSQLAAHSVMFANPEADDSTIVLDNIETNEGRNRDNVAGLYREFFKQYLTDPAMARFDTVHLGIHALDEYKTLLKGVEPIPSPLSYSDARARQSLLYTTNPNFGPEFTPMTDGFVSHYVSFHQAIYDGGVELPDRRTFNSDMFADTHSYVISTEEGEPVGYAIAHETDTKDALEEGDDETEVIYIEDLAILPANQHEGHGEKAFRGYLELAQMKQKPLLFHARDASSWKIIETKQAELQEIGFSVEVVSEVSDYFSQNEGAHIIRITPPKKEGAQASQTEANLVESMNN